MLEDFYDKATELTRLYPEFRIMEYDNIPLFKINYIHKKGNTFDDPFSLNCRGTTFTPDGEIIALPLHKFFNLNGQPETSQHNICKPNYIVM